MTGGGSFGFDRRCAPPADNEAPSRRVLRRRGYLARSLGASEREQEQGPAAAARRRRRAVAERGGAGEGRASEQANTASRTHTQHTHSHNNNNATQAPLDPPFSARAAHLFIYQQRIFASARLAPGAPRFLKWGVGHSEFFHSQDPRVIKIFLFQ